MAKNDQKCNFSFGVPRLAEVVGTYIRGFVKLVITDFSVGL